MLRFTHLPSRRSSKLWPARTTRQIPTGACVLYVLIGT